MSYSFFLIQFYTNDFVLLQFIFFLLHVLACL